MKLKTINLLEGQVGAICRGIKNTDFDRVEMIDDNLLVNFAGFGVDSVLRSIDARDLTW